MKAIKDLEQKVDSLQKTVSNNGNGGLASKDDKAEQSKIIHCFNCKECNLSFENKSRLKKHVNEKHQKKIECYTCNITCISNIDLEVHMITHKQPKFFKCDLCDKDFYLKWRLTKHKEGHEQKRRFCHYFNNKQECPYEENGCMFVHAMSPVCAFTTKCAYKMCQFRHPTQTTHDHNSDKSTSEIIIEEHVEQSVNMMSSKTNDSEGDSEMELAASNDLDQSKHDDDEVYPCDSCDNVFNDIEDLIDHYGETAHNI